MSVVDSTTAAFRFFNDTLRRPRFWCAPMVGASELAFRMTVRELGCSIAHTPMIDACGYARNPRYREEFRWHEDDTPLVVQVCGNRCEDLVAAGLLLERCPGVCAIELNLGCPQRCAKRGNYGAFLMTQPELVRKLVKSMVQHLTVPIFCKIRVFDDNEATCRFATMLTEAGASLLTVHGRTIDAERNGAADWEAIAEVKRRCRGVPVIANGNVRKFSDVLACLRETGTDGVMSACALLNNPALFSGPSSSRSSLDLADMYLRNACLHQAAHQQITRHLSCILKKPLARYPSFRKDIVGFRGPPSAAENPEMFRALLSALAALRERIISDDDDDDDDRLRDR